jgi:hypothetical protein
MLHRKSGKNVSVGETIQINICDSKNLGKTLPIRSPKQLSSEFNPKLLCQKGIFGASGLSASDSDIKDNNGVAQFDGLSLKSIKNVKGSFTLSRYEGTSSEETAVISFCASF